MKVRDVITLSDHDHVLMQDAYTCGLHDDFTSHVGSDVTH